jgi:putative endonuclease
VYYVYILKNQTKSKIYIGYTDDLKRRIKEHKHKNLELVYYEVYKSEKDARLREMKLKQHGQTKRRLKERLRHSLT